MIRGALWRVRPATGGEREQANMGVVVGPPVAELRRRRRQYSDSGGLALVDTGGGLFADHPVPGQWRGGGGWRGRPGFHRALHGRHTARRRRGLVVAVEPDRGLRHLRRLYGRRVQRAHLHVPASIGAVERQAAGSLGLERRARAPTPWSLPISPASTSPSRSRSSSATRAVRPWPRHRPRRAQRDLPCAWGESSVRSRLGDEGSGRSAVAETSREKRRDRDPRPARRQVPDRSHDRSLPRLATQLPPNHAVRLRKASTHQSGYGDAIPRRSYRKQGMCHPPGIQLGADPYGLQGMAPSARRPRMMQNDNNQIIRCATIRAWTGRAPGCRAASSCDRGSCARFPAPGPYCRGFPRFADSR